MVCNGMARKGLMQIRRKRGWRFWIMSGKWSMHSSKGGWGREGGLQEVTNAIARAHFACIASRWNAVNHCSSSATMNNTRVQYMWCAWCTDVNMLSNTCASCLSTCIPHVNKLSADFIQLHFMCTCLCVDTDTCPCVDTDTCAATSVCVASVI